MNRFTKTREYYIPTGAMKVGDKMSSAVAYLFERDGYLCALAFHGRAAKPAWRYRFDNAKQREHTIREHFSQVRACEAAKKALLAKGRGLAVGDVLCASWGYDQTNIDFYEVTALVGRNKVEVRELRAEIVEGGDMMGLSIPLPGDYAGAPFRRVAQEGRIKVDSCAHANLMVPETVVSGVRVYKPKRWTAYA